MSSARSTSENRLIGAILRVCFLFGAPAIVLALSQLVFATGVQKSGQAAITRDSAGTRQIEKHEVQWIAPKFVKLVDNQHGRIMISGEAMPGTKIKLGPYAASIDARNQAHDLTRTKMNPSPKELTVGPDGDFKFYLTLPFEHVQIPFIATTSGQKSQSYILIMVVRKNRAPIVVSGFQKTTNNSHWSFGFEGRSVTFSQTNLSNLNETMLAIDVSYERELSKRFSFMAQSFIDIAGNAPLSTAQELPSQYWHLNSDVIYLLPLRSPKWSIGIAGGLYYMTMLSSGTKFGYSDLWGPELYPIFTYSLNSADAMSFYFKYSPNASNFSPNFTNHEAAAGVEWTRFFNSQEQTQNRQSLTFKLEYLQDAFSHAGLSTQSSAVNFGVLYGLP